MVGRCYRTARIVWCRQITASSLALNVRSQYVCVRAVRRGYDTAESAGDSMEARTNAHQHELSCTSSL